MTIYILGTAQETAQSLDDKSLDRMIKYIAQVLCDAHYFLSEGDYKKNYSTPLPLSEVITNWSQWARECVANYNYLVELRLKCCYEFFHRFLCCGEWESSGCFECGKYLAGAHKNEYIMEWAQDNIPNLHSGDETPFPLVMPKKFIQFSILLENSTMPKEIYLSYKSYYVSKLKPSATWTRREKPEWITI